MEILAFLLNLVIFNKKKKTNRRSINDGCVLQIPHFKGNQPNPNTRNAVGGGGGGRQNKGTKEKARAIKPLVN